MRKLIAISSLILASTSVFAQFDILTALDADKDGRISIEEANADQEISEAFAALDIDQDGYLSERELQD